MTMNDVLTRHQRYLTFCAGHNIGRTEAERGLPNNPEASFAQWDRVCEPAPTSDDERPLTPEDLAVLRGLIRQRHSGTSLVKTIPEQIEALKGRVDAIAQVQVDQATTLLALALKANTQETQMACVHFMERDPHLGYRCHWCGLKQGVARRPEGA